MIYRYNCIVCGKENKSTYEKDPLLCICSECKKTNQELLKKNRSIIQQRKAQEQKAYWDKHPEEYKAFREEKNKKRIATQIEKYGSLENANKIRYQKQMDTLKKMYPDEDWDNITNPSQLKVARENIKKKSAEKDSQFWEDRKKKAETTKIEKYGSLENAYAIMNSNLKNTITEKYGVEKVTDIPGTIEKRQETIKQKLEENPGFWKDRNEKSKATKIEKYGSLELADKISKEKREKTCLERYGSTSPLKNEQVKQKIKNTFREKYGVEDNISQREGHAERMKATIDRKAEIFEEENNCTRLTTLIEKYGQGWLKLDLPLLKNKSYCFVSNEYLPQIEEYYRIGHSRASHTEKGILEFVKSVYKGEVLENVRNILKPYTYELDMYIPEKKVAIEYNGDFWHCSENKEKRYHETKSKICEEQGIRLIHIYECEWKYMREKLESLIRIALGCGYSKIGARKCEVRKIDNKEAKPFNEKNHLQGHRNAEVTYGLYYNNELQQLMSFSKCKYNRNLKGENDWEIIRGCPGSNNQIVGGVSKLFRAFVREYNPDTVFSYCDYNKFDGKGYEALGMELIGYTGPDKFYVDKSEHKVNRNPKKRKQLEESMLFTIWGAGSKKYIWRKNA